MDRGNNGLLRTLDQIPKFRQRDAPRRLAELRDIGAGYEGLAVTDEHNRFRMLVRVRPAESFSQPIPQRCRQRIHRRVIDGNDRDILLAQQLDQAHWAARAFASTASPTYG